MDTKLIHWGYSFCDIGLTLSGWSTVDMHLWWYNESATSAQSRQYSAPSGMIQIWGWQFKMRFLSGACSRSTPCFHWSYRLLPLQLPLSAQYCRLCTLLPQWAAGFRSPQHHTKLCQRVLTSPHIGALINWALIPLQLPLCCLQIQQNHYSHTLNIQTLVCLFHTAVNKLKRCAL